MVVQLAKKCPKCNAVIQEELKGLTHKRKAMAGLPD
jgi:phage FluMu protein Com